MPIANSRATQPIAALQLGAVVVCALALVWRAEAAAANLVIPIALSAAFAASAAGQRADLAARRLVWVAALAMWLAAAMVGLEIARG